MLPSDEFVGFRNKCPEIYEIDPAHFLSAPRLVWQPCLKDTEVALELITDGYMLLLVEEGIIRGISHVVHKHTITKNKYMKDYEPSTSCNGMSQIYMDGPCHKSWIKNESRSLRNHTKL